MVRWQCDIMVFVMLVVCYMTLGYDDMGMILGYDEMGYDIRV